MQFSSIKDDGDDNRALLFSAQFFLGSADLTLPRARCSDLLVGFQLLQYEIVLFDAARITPSDDDSAPDALDSDTSHVVLTLEHGKSCLFDADAEELALDLQRTCDAPLALMVMQQEHGKARLVAFASVPVELHAGLLHTSTTTCESASSTTASLNDAMRYRVCEWASSSGSWELRDHANQVVGAATGAVTLSCLGRTLAPHIANAIGLRVDRAVLPDANASSTAVQSEATADTSDAPPPKCALNHSGDASLKHTAASEPAPTEQTLQLKHSVDMAVQCDDERFAADEEDTFEAPLDSSIQRTASGNAHVFPAIIVDRTAIAANATPRSTRESRAHVRSPTLSTPPQTRIGGRHVLRIEQHANASQQHPRSSRGNADALAPALFAPELPPPLYFQKPKATRKS